MAISVGLPSCTCVNARSLSSSIPNSSASRRNASHASFTSEKFAMTFPERRSNNSTYVRIVLLKRGISESPALGPKAREILKRWSAVADDAEKFAHHANLHMTETKLQA